MAIISPTSSRGMFRVDGSATLLITISDLTGVPQDPSTITVVITDANSTVHVTAVPETVAAGVYAYEWVIPENQTPGDYVATWSYTIDDEDYTQVQNFNVVADPDPPTGILSLYSGKVLDMRTALGYHLRAMQNIPVQNEEGRSSSNYTSYKFNFENWNVSSRCRVYLNGQLQESGFVVDYYKGKVVFANALTEYDTVTADYTFRWFGDEDLDRFMSNGLHMLNLNPPVTRYNLLNLPDYWIATVLYAAIVDAIRSLMLSLLTQEAQLVFGGPEGARNMYTNLESLKKNYEGSLEKAIEQKKNGPYIGLTRMVSTPEYTLPGGRSRWFRYLFSGG